MPGLTEHQGGAVPKVAWVLPRGVGVVRGGAEPRCEKVPRDSGNLTDFIPLGGNTAVGIAPPWKKEFPIQNFLQRLKARGSALPAPHPPR